MRSPDNIGKPVCGTSSLCAAIRLPVRHTRRILAAMPTPPISSPGLHAIAPFEISVGAYPETHPAAATPLADLDSLKRKLDAGATRAITQYFFDTDVYLRFLDRCLAAGITAPVVPGIMPVSNYAQIARFSAMCGASVPPWLGRLFEGPKMNLNCVG